MPCVAEDSGPDKGKKPFPLLWVVAAFILIIFIVRSPEEDRSLNHSGMNRVSGNKKAGTIRSLPPAGRTFPFYVYTAEKSSAPFYLSGFMGDRQDLRIHRKKKGRRGNTVLMMVYAPSSEEREKGWTGLYWQFPQNNWGTDPEGGYDLRGSSYCSFWAKGERGGECLEFKIGGINGPYGDSDEATTGMITLSSNWRSYRIDLKGKDLSRIAGGFSFFIMRKFNRDGAVFFLDDIRYCSGSGL